MTDGRNGTSDSCAVSEGSGKSFRVSVKIPPFYPEKPVLWFAQLEAQFTMFNITDDTIKFYYAMAYLERPYALEVEDIIMSPPVQNKYEELKKKLIKRLSESRIKKVKQLLLQAELGDRTPSQFLHHLQNIAGSEVPEDFLRTIWTNKLPAEIQTIVASQLRSSLEHLAELADRIHDIVTPPPQLAVATTIPGSSIEKLALQVAELTKQMKTLTARMDRSSRPRSRSRSCSRYRSGSTRSRSNFRKFPVCWYHYKFGSQARKCTKPCVYT